MAIQRLESIPGICKNPKCDNFKLFELYTDDEIKREGDVFFVFCYLCNEKVLIDD